MTEPVQGEGPTGTDSDESMPLPKDTSVATRRRTQHRLLRDVGLPLLALGVVAAAIVTIQLVRSGFSGTRSGGGSVGGNYSQLQTGPETGAGLKIGKPALGFRLATADGDMLALSDYRGKPVVVNFWATWCVPCRVETPDLIKLQKGWGSSVQMLGVDVQETPADVRTFAAQFGSNYPLIIDSSGDVVSAYHIYGLPQTFFIDPQGVLRDYRIGVLKPEIAQCIINGMADTGYRPKDCR